MLKRSHLLVSISGSLALLRYSHPDLSQEPGANLVHLAAILAGTALGSLTPDLDKVFPARLAKSIFNFLTLPLRFFRRIRVDFGHRTFSHSLLALAFFTLITLGEQANPEHELIFLFLLGHLYGYAFHLVADMTTAAGIPLLWPFSRRKFHLLPPKYRVVTGKSPLEGVYTAILVLFGLFIFVVGF